MKCAVVGLGIGMAHVAGYLTSPHAELVAVADRMIERRERVGGTFAAGSMRVLEPLFHDALMPDRILERDWQDIGARVYDDIEGVLADPDTELVSICTPGDVHEDHAVRALEAGKHVLLEKPPALSLEGAERVREAARRAGRRVAVGYEFRVNPAVERLRRLVTDGELGELAAFSLHHFRTPFRRDKWQGWIQDRARSGGLLVEETCHWFDLARWVTGREPADVHCVGSGSVHGDFNYEDIAFVQGSYRAGARVSVEGPADGGGAGGGRGGAAGTPTASELNSAGANRVAAAGSAPAVYQIAHALTGFDFSLVIQVHGTRGTAWCGLKEERWSSLDGGAAEHFGVVSRAAAGASPRDAEIVTYGPEATEPWNIRECVARTVAALTGGTPFPAGLDAGVRSLVWALAARDSLDADADATKQRGVPL